MSTRSAPPGPPGHPLIGHLAEIAREPLEFFTRCARDYGDIVRYRVAHVTSFLLNHPDYFKYVLVDHSRAFIKGRVFRANRLLFGDGLLTSEGDDWREQRRMMQPAFNHQRVATYGQVMVEYAERMMANWHDGEVRDIHQDMNHLSQEIAAKTLFDADLSDETEEISRAVQVCMAQFQLRSRTAFLIPTALPTPGNLRLRRAVHWLDGVIYRMIRERQAQPGDRGDLLSMLLQVQTAEGGGLSDRQLRDEVMTSFLAGHDPVGVALAWTWYVLAQRPQVEEKLLAELHAVLGRRSPRVEDLPELRYTEMVVKEALRLYPPIWAMVRTVIQDCEIGGYRIRAGNSLAMSQWVMHRDARYFENSLEFQPERWAADRLKSPPRFAFLPFGTGARVCIGEPFALLELRLIVATIAPRFRFTLVKDQTIELLPSITLHPKNGIKVQITRRS
jgi:cytochrome P450